MKHFRTFLGYAIAGMFVMSVWGALSDKYGLLGGWFAGLCIIAPMWFLNHYLGIINNENGAAFVDQALGIAIAGTMRDVFLAGSINPLVQSIPTLIIVILGGMTGGICAAAIQKDMAKEAVITANESKELNV
ncbi:Lin0368 family putative glycerol transporter subunit [Fonticella tunisiensis]|uniref:Uncharacterized protein n=1 Tax=Fonticella tunisiensis TaxID=1096341 RepID=A0A4R7KCE0_9CLOT|nr:hypothetical protein [Fonticella tunisiensis]TDT50346.1 hypothetical protein EDD71_1306 [Fonticella tunisiensis]